jgi:hypothetical protein
LQLFHLGELVGEKTGIPDRALTADEALPCVEVLGCEGDAFAVEQVLLHLREVGLVEGEPEVPHVYHQAPAELRPVAVFGGLLVALGDAVDELGRAREILGGVPMRVRAAGHTTSTLFPKDCHSRGESSLTESKSNSAHPLSLLGLFNEGFAPQALPRQAFCREKNAVLLDDMHTTTVLAYAFVR